MKSIPLAMTWELFRRGRWWLIGGVLAANAMPAFVFSELERNHGRLDLISQHDPSFFQLPFIMLQLGMFIFGAAVFSAHGQPSRLYTLPVSATTIVTWHLLPAMTLMFVETVASTALLNATFHVGWPLWGPAIFMTVMLAAIDAVFWLTDKSAWAAVGIALVAAVFGVWFKSRFGPVFSHPTHHWEALSVLDLLTMLAAGLVTFAAAVWSVQRQRRGDLIPPLGIVAWFRQAFAGTGARRKHFRSPAHAQFWFEWRQKGWIMPAAIFLILLGGFGVWLAFSRSQWDLIHGLFGIGLFSFLIGFIGGIVIGNVGQSDADPRISQFLATLPITTAQHARTILKVAGTSMVLAWGIWLIAWLIACIPVHQNVLAPPGNRYMLRDTWWLPFTLLSPWLVLTIGASVRMTGRIKPLAALGLGVVTLIFIYPLAIYILAEHDRIAVVAGIAIAAMTTWLLIAARRRSLIGWPTTSAALIPWGSLAGVTVYYFLRVESPSSLSVFLSGVLGLVVAPLAAFPLALALNRHR